MKEDDSEGREEGLVKRGTEKYKVLCDDLERKRCDTMTSSQLISSYHIISHLTEKNQVRM